MKKNDVKKVKPIKIVDDSVLLDCDGVLYWIDVWQDEFELLADFNQYIFLLDDPSDVERKEFQENIYNIDLCFSVALNYYEFIKNL